MHRPSAVLLAALAGLALAAPLASADAPDREDVTFSDRTFTGQCAFPVFRHVLVNRSVQTTFSDGSRLLTGTFMETLTNVSTGKTIEVNASGPSYTVFHDDGSSTENGTGPQFVRPPGRLLLTTGPVTTERNAAGSITAFTHDEGTTQDVCELLA